MNQIVDKFDQNLTSKFMDGSNKKKPLKEDEDKCEEVLIVPKSPMAKSPKSIQFQKIKKLHLERQAREA